ncbi:glycine zipper 2TM domain-containing protein [Cupriavidus necator]|uniref:glycine zipper 2TM domain-containing protein n=1 Tax=Cupriavidus TaxID=106589 RepID=UPI0014902522|nr:glycine zipper 2TM domain-containing protein [Cupriavidus necator]MDQ0142446.1 outer membrane lipoprotein SlyB [Cupriavidus necator]NOV25780.1 glycine zipper 2TM domain-containing protein [Cupriavidus necator]
MRIPSKTWLIVPVAAAAALAGCAAPYNSGYDTGYNAPPPGYQTPNPGYQTPNTSQAPAGAVYYGRVESIEPVTTTQGSSGLLGTVIGGAAGGLLGHQVGGGRGQTAATIGGAVVGAVAGNQIEKRAGSNTQTVYRVNVRLDDGRLATVTQSNLGSLQVGMRARVANDMATPY